MGIRHTYGDREAGAKMPKRLIDALENCHSAGFGRGAIAWGNIIKGLMMDELRTEMVGDKEMHHLLASGSCHHTAALGLAAPAFEGIFAVAVASSYANPDKEKGREDLVANLTSFIEAAIGLALPPSIPQELADVACKDAMKSSIELERDILSIRREVAAKFGVKLQNGEVVGASDMFARAYFGKKSVKLALSDKIPELDDEQVEAAWAMAHDRRKLLFSDPGAGKTLTALQAMLLVEEELDEKGERPQLTAIILVPPIAVGTWMRWIAAVYEYVERPCVIQIVKAGYDKIRPDATHVILTYGLLSQSEISPVVDALRRCDTAILICDESDNLTGIDSNRTRRVFGHDLTGGIDSFCYHAEWLWFLTGTPIPRHNDGLYPVLRAVFPDMLDAYSVKTWLIYRNTFCRTELVKFGKMRQVKEKISGSRNNKLLNDILFGDAVPIAIRIKLNLSTHLIEREVTITPKFSEEFKKLEAELEYLPQIDPEARQIDPRIATAQRIMATECAPAVAEYVKEAFKKDQCNRAVTLGKVILYVHREAGTIIGNMLIRAGYRVRFINGSTDASEDAETERRFNAGECDVVVGQIKAMGVAINLQERCDHVIFAEETYSNAANMQAYQRVYRRGQSRDVRVDYCRPLSFLADIKVVSADAKGKSAGEVLDGKV